MNSVQRNVCVNCRIRFHVNTLQARRIETLLNPLRSILVTWISPEQISDSDSICCGCFRILERIHSTNNPNPIREYGHTRICLCCGVSLRSSRSRHVPQDCPERTVLLQWIPIHQHHNLNNVCYPCWLRANRAANRIRLHDANRQDDFLPDPMEKQWMNNLIFRRLTSSSERGMGTLDHKLSLNIV